MSDYLRRCGWQTEAGALRPAVEVEGQLLRRALDLARELGAARRSPRANSGLNVARTAQTFDLAQHGADVDGEAADG